MKKVLTHTTSDEVLAAWREQLIAATRQPLAAEILKERSQELWPRFSRFYKTLQALPRRRRRSLQRRLKQTLAGVALLLALGSEPALAATIDVDGEDCTLIDAITAANSDTATGGCPAGSGADVITLRPGSTHTLTSVNSNRYIHNSCCAFGPFPLGLPIITSDTVLQGNGATIERASTAPEFNILAVHELESPVKFTLKQTTITGGLSGLMSLGADVTIADSTISGNLGDGVFYKPIRTDYYASKSLTITNSTISGNLRNGVKAISVFGTSAGILEINNSTISDNSDNGVSANAFMQGAIQATISDSTISGNMGDGFFSYSGSYDRHYSAFLNTTIVNSTISDNKGRGVSASSHDYGDNILSIVGSTISGNNERGVSAFATETGFSSLSIANSTISGNSAKKFGGGVFVGQDEFFDYYYHPTSKLVITDSTITGNSAGVSGGGLHINLGGHEYVLSSSEATIKRSIISGNSAPLGPEIHSEPDANYSQLPFPVTVDNFNLFGVDGEAGVEGLSPGPTDITPASGVLLNDILDPVLADNGGSTQTHALVEGSPALDAVAVSEPGCSGVDQRGVSRPQDGNADGIPTCDIGAYELAADAVPFARFNIDSGQVELVQMAGRDKFDITGSFRLDTESNGIDVLNEGVVVTFNGYTEAIPPGSFRFVGWSDDDDELPGRQFTYTSSSAGIKRLTLTVGSRSRGQFSIKARGLDLDDLKLPAEVDVMLRIGDDVGQTTIPLDRKGRLDDDDDADD